MRTTKIAIALALAGCAKEEAKPLPPVTAEPQGTFSIVGTRAPASAAAASASAASSASASASAVAPASASAAVAPRAPSSGAAAAASAPAPPSSAAAAPASPPAPNAPLEPASTRLAGNHFALEIASPGCRVDAACTMTLRLTATSGYHVNAQYPYKFTADEAPAVTFLGKDSPRTFSRASGDLEEHGETAATLTVRFKPTAPGKVKISGVYKLSVCSAENCQIETPRTELAIPVM